MGIPTAPQAQQVAFVEGITVDEFESTEVSAGHAPASGLRFPVDYETKKWTTCDAEVVNMEISQDARNLLVVARNGDYQEWLYFSIQPPRAGITDGYKKRMISIFKTFGIYKTMPNGTVDLDATKLDQAIGKLFRFGSIPATDESGNLITTQKGIPIANRIINGPVEKLWPIGNGAAQTTAQPPANVHYNDDIPF